MVRNPGTSGVFVSTSGRLAGHDRFQDLVPEPGPALLRRQEPPPAAAYQFDAAAVLGQDRQLLSGAPRIQSNR